MSINSDVIIITDEPECKLPSKEEITYSLQSSSVAKSDYTCPICACTVTDDEKQHICETCGTPHHMDCWEYAGGCAIFGCRKGIIRQTTGVDNFNNNLAPINLGLMRMWGWFFRIHWLTFIVTALGLLGSTVGGTIYMALKLLSTYLTGGFFIGATGIFGFLCVLPAIAIPLGALAYMLLLPAAIVMRIHFYTINLTLPTGNSALAKSIADRVDMPDTVHFIRKLSAILAKIIEYLMLILLLAGLIMNFAGGVSSAFFGGFVILMAVRLIMLPLFKAALESRVTILITFQNRLIASSKQSKDSHL
jgi:hypothetical protein